MQSGLGRSPYALVPLVLPQWSGLLPYGLSPTSLHSYPHTMLQQHEFTP